MVLAASVTAVGALLGTALSRFRRENRSDHAEVIRELRWLRRIVERVETKHDRHIDDFHLKGPDGQPKERGQSTVQEER